MLLWLVLMCWMNQTIWLRALSHVMGVVEEVA